MAVTALAFNTFSGGIVPAGANHLPADKPFAAASKVQTIGANATVTLLTATVKNSKPADMMLHVTLECSILTNTVITGGPEVTSETAEAEGRVRVWIEIDGKVVPIVSSSSTPQLPPPPGDETDKVTFCNREHVRSVTDMEEDTDGIDGSTDYLRTKTANAFNWVRLNMGSGVHTIVLKGEFFKRSTDGSMADAYVGNRSMIGVPGKFANDATISEGSI